MQDKATIPQSLQTSQRRLRFSLRSLILWIGLICLFLSNVVALKELAELRSENQSLRDELGHVTIQDPEKVHVIAVPRLGALIWRWRVYVPQRGTYALICTPGAKDYGLSNFDAGVKIPLEPGEHTMEAAICREDQQRWSLKVSNLGTPLAVMSGSDGAWNVYLPWVGYPIEKIGSTTKTLDPQGRLVLLETEDYEATQFGGTVDTQGPRLRMWIEQTSLQNPAPSKDGNLTNDH